MVLILKSFLFFYIFISSLILIHPKKLNIVNSLESDNFNVFEYINTFKNTTELLYNIVDYALNNLIPLETKKSLIDENKMKNFLFHLSNEYNSNTMDGKNPYHNVYHAADVVQKLYILLKKVKNTSKILNFNEKFKYLDYFALIISAAAHDFKHPGRNNNFYNKNKNVPLEKELKKYNFQLEKYHFEETMKLINQNDYNILSKLNDEQKNRFIHIMEESIISTDISFNKVNTEFLENFKEDEISDEIKFKILGCFLHAADISNPTKDINSFIGWSKKLAVESCNQYKDEVKYKFEKFSGVCFMNSKEFYENGLKFLGKVVMPFFDQFCKAFTDLNYLCKSVNDNYYLLLYLFYIKE